MTEEFDPLKIRVPLPENPDFRIDICNFKGSDSESFAAVRGYIELEVMSALKVPANMLGLGKEQIEIFLVTKLSALLSKQGKVTLPEVTPLVDLYCALPGNDVGGSLHIVLEDGNIKDGDIRYCIEVAETAGDKCGSLLGKAILKMSKTQRRKLTRVSLYIVDRIDRNGQVREK